MWRNVSIISWSNTSTLVLFGSFLVEDSYVDFLFDVIAEVVAIFFYLASFLGIPLFSIWQNVPKKNEEFVPTNCDKLLIWSNNDKTLYRIFPYLHSHTFPLMIGVGNMGC